MKPADISHIWCNNSKFYFEFCKRFYDKFAAYQGISLLSTSHKIYWALFFQGEGMR
jgi:hypothetical protein